MKNILYGDGIHDDYLAIQEMLDSKVCEVALPAPKVNYSISKTLKIHGGQTLRLPRTAVIKLIDGSNCTMIEDCDFKVGKENICIDGGIWDYNNLGQDPNPYHFPNKNGISFTDRLKKVNLKSMGEMSKLPYLLSDIYLGYCMRFCNIKNLIVKNLTIKNPVCYGIQIACVKDFFIENIYFDYQVGNPKLWNMDGIHVEGNCYNGIIKNLHGDCHDDYVALTADDGLYGTIENIVVDGIYSTHSHSAVRILSHGLHVDNVVIRNIFGKYYTYCVGITKYHNDVNRGKINNVYIENVFASSCEGTKDVAGGNFPFIWVENGLDVNNLNIKNIVREEYVYSKPTIRIDEDVNIDVLNVANIILKNFTQKAITNLEINGKIENKNIVNVIEK